MDNVQADLLLEIAQGSEHFSKCLIFHVQHFEIHALLYFNNIMYVYLCVCTHVFLFFFLSIRSRLPLAFSQPCRDGIGDHTDPDLLGSEST